MLGLLFYFQNILLLTDRKHFCFPNAKMFWLITSSKSKVWTPNLFVTVNFCKGQSPRDQLATLNASTTMHLRYFFLHQKRGESSHTEEGDCQYDFLRVSVCLCLTGFMSWFSWALTHHSVYTGSFLQPKKHNFCYVNTCSSFNAGSQSWTINIESNMLHRHSDRLCVHASMFVSFLWCWASAYTVYTLWTQQILSFFPQVMLCRSPSRNFLPYKTK